MADKHLRAVSPDDSAPAPTPRKSLSEAIESGSYLEILKAQRDDIAKQLPNEKGAPLAALHGHLAKLSKEIEVLERAQRDSIGGAPALADGICDRFDASAI